MNVRTPKKFFPLSAPQKLVLGTFKAMEQAIDKMVVDHGEGIDEGDLMILLCAKELNSKKPFFDMITLHEYFEKNWSSRYRSFGLQRFDLRFRKLKTKGYFLRLGDKKVGVSEKWVVTKQVDTILRILSRFYNDILIDTK